jgi:hypothetical protein
VAIKEYTTTFQGATPTQDPTPVTDVQPDLTNDSFLGAGDGDAMRVSQLLTLRDKIDAVARLLGDSADNPAGSVADILGRDNGNGDARQLRLRDRGTDPAAVADKAFIYAKDSGGGLIKAYVRFSNGTVIEIGSGGGGSSPLHTKGDVYGYSTVDARIPIGVDGAVLTVDAAQALGLKWAVPSTSFVPVEDAFVSTGGETPGAFLEFTLSDTPRGGAYATPSTYDLGVYRNGVRLKYEAVPSSQYAYYYVVATNKIRVLASGEVDDFAAAYTVVP